MLGLVFLGGVIMLFVNRLTWDIVRVRQRALDIVDGRLTSLTWPEVKKAAEAVLSRAYSLAAVREVRGLDGFASEAEVFE